MQITEPCQEINLSLCNCKTPEDGDEKRKVYGTTLGHAGSTDHHEIWDGSRENTTGGTVQSLGSRNHGCPKLYLPLCCPPGNRLLHFFSLDIKYGSMSSQGSIVCQDIHLHAWLQELEKPHLTHSSSNSKACVSVNLASAVKEHNHTENIGQQYLRWTPRLLCLPEHSRHIHIPYVTLTH